VTHPENLLDIRILLLLKRRFQMLQKDVFLQHPLPQEQWPVAVVNATIRGKLLLDVIGTAMAVNNPKAHHQTLPPHPILLVLQTAYDQE